MTRRGRMAAIFFAIATIVGSLKHAEVFRSYSPYFYGFLVSPTAGGTERKTLRYINRMHEVSPFYTTASDVFQAFTGAQLEWIYFPGAIIIGVLVYALLPADISAPTKLLISLSSIIGPVGVFGYYYGLTRDAFDMILLLTFLLIFYILYRTGRGFRYLFPTIVGFSFLIWANHYSFWPLFALIIGLWSLHFSRIKLYQVAIGLLAPSIMLVDTVGIFISSIAFITEMWGQRNILVFGGRVQILDWYQFVGPLGRESPVWLPEYQYGAIAVTLAVFAVLYIYSLIRSQTYDPRDWTATRRSIYLVGVAAGVYSVLLIIRGYLYRAIIIWPLFIVLFQTELHAVWSEISIGYERTAAVLAATLLLIGMVPMMTPYFHHSQSVNEPSDKQIQSTEFSQYTTTELVYTDLVHGSLLILDGDRSVVVGRSAVAENGSVAINRELQTLAGTWHNDAQYVLVTSKGGVGLRTWQGAIPPLDLVDDNYQYQKIYNNKQDSWYARRDRD